MGRPRRPPTWRRSSGVLAGTGRARGPPVPPERPPRPPPAPGTPATFTSWGSAAMRVSGAAILAQQMGDRVTGSDDQRLPAGLGHRHRGGHPVGERARPAHLNRWGVPDLVVVGNQCAPSTRSGWRPSVGGFRSAARSSSSSP